MIRDKLAGFLQLVYFNIGYHTFFVDIPAFGRKIFRGGQLDDVAFLKGPADGLNQSLSKSGMADQHTNSMVLYGSGQNLRCAGTVFIDQYGQGNLQILLVCFVFFPIAMLVFTVQYQAFRKQLIPDCHTFIQQAARVVAQIQYHALHPPGTQFLHSPEEIGGGILIKPVQPQVSDFVVQHFVFHIGKIDNLPGDAVFLGFAVTQNGNLYFSIRLAAHLAYCSIQHGSIHIFSIDVYDLITCHNAGFCSGASLNCIHNGNHVVFLVYCNGKTHSRIGSFHIHQKILVFLCCQIIGIRIIQGSDHTL